MTVHYRIFFQTYKLRGLRLKTRVFQVMLASASFKTNTAISVQPRDHSIVTRPFSSSEVGSGHKPIFTPIPLLISSGAFDHTPVKTQGTLSLLVPLMHFCLASQFPLLTCVRSLSFNQPLELANFVADIECSIYGRITCSCM